MAIRLWVKSALLMGCLCVSMASSLLADEVADWTIPVIDMQKFYDEDTKKEFYLKVSQALHEVGFFAVVNTGLNMDDLTAGYEAVKEFFYAPVALKREIYRPELSGQRGYVPSETAQGNGKIDFKEFLHIGRDNNFWPSWMQLQQPTEKLITALDIFSEYIQEALAFSFRQPHNFFIDMTKNGACLLRPIHYPPNPEPGQFWAAEHTDIDLFTILPMATEDGLQLFYQGEWIDIRVPANAFIVNAGDKLQNMSNGYYKSGKHRVVSKPGCERFSIVYFVHPQDEDAMDPLPEMIELTGGQAKFPKATSWELLAVRLRELKLINSVWMQRLQTCGINERIQELVLSGKADDSVKLTYDLWVQWLKSDQ